MRRKGRYGPYRTSDGYLFYCVVHADGSKRSVFAHREVMEAHLGRKLAKNEHIHHKDGNPSNNDLLNLEVTTASQHAKHHALGRPPEMVRAICPTCDSTFLALARYVRHNQNNQGKAGPFCSKRCAGKYGAKVGKGGHGGGRPPRVQMTKALELKATALLRAGHGTPHVAKIVGISRWQAIQVQRRIEKKE